MGWKPQKLEPFRLAELKTKLNCFRDKNLLDIRHDLPSVSWVVQEFSLCKASCVSTAVQDARRQLNSLTFALSS